MPGHFPMRHVLRRLLQLQRLIVDTATAIRDDVVRVDRTSLQLRRLIPARVETRGGRHSRGAGARQGEALQAGPEFDVVLRMATCAALQGNARGFRSHLRRGHDDPGDFHDLRDFRALSEKRE